MIRSEQELEALLSAPYEEDVAALQDLKGDLILLGAGGKMGPTLVARAVLANRDTNRKIYAVARHGNFIDGTTVIRADLSDRKQVDALPDAPNVLYLVGRKFGSTGAEHLTWGANAIVPAVVAERYAGAKIVALSTGNVYPFVPIESGGATEDTKPAPIGEYAWSALARERVFEYFAAERATPVAILRLNYAVEQRYGTLVDIASKVLAGEPIDLTMGYFNCIWQGDANSICLRAFSICSTPQARILNMTGLETLRVRDIAEEFGKRFGRTPQFTGQEAPTALLNNAAESAKLFGKPRVSVQQMMDWIADWLQHGGTTLNKPTHFEVRTGTF
ncbi:epimerase [Bryobacterales bacterium F-183]|nr:epimerase [Bryobacterales bacterium F-183]